MYNRTTVQGATFDMRGQLYRRVVRALGSRVGRPGLWSWPGQGVVPLRRAGKKKMRAPLLGLAKSIY